MAVRNEHESNPKSYSRTYIGSFSPMSPCKKSEHHVHAQVCSFVFCVVRPEGWALSLQYLFMEVCRWRARGA
jgi:hypothetical protein